MGGDRVGAAVAGRGEGRQGGVAVAAVTWRGDKTKTSMLASKSTQLMIQQHFPIVSGSDVIHLPRMPS
jgi:hypothetical protein